MSPIRLAILTGCLVLSGAAGAAGGVVHLYLQPLPPDAARLSFTIGSVAAIGADGVTHALQLHLPSLNRSEAGRQRLLASGRLPAGSYAGLLLEVERAALETDAGKAALLVPDAPVTVDLQFAVTGTEAPVVWLTLRYPDSVPGGVRFDPAFAAVVPPKPMPHHAGFVTNTRSDTITVFDKERAQAVAVIETCASPYGMALDHRRRRLYVACTSDDEIHAIDVATAAILERAPLSPGDRPRELALTPDGATLLAVNTGSNTVSFFDARSLARQERVNVGTGPGSILMDSAGRRAFVFNTLSSTVSVVDVPGRSLVATVTVEAAPLRGQFDARGDRLYVIHERLPQLTVLDPRQLSVVRVGRLRTSADAIAFDPVRNLVCLGGRHDTTVGFYDPNALLPVRSLRINSGTTHLTVDVEDNMLYMVSPDTRSVILGRLSDRKVVGEIDVGDGPSWVSVMGEK